MPQWTAASVPLRPWREAAVAAALPRRCCRCGERHRQCVGNVLHPHGGAQLLGDDVAGEVIEHGRQIEPAPADDLQIGEVSLPQPVRRRRLVLELVGRLDDDAGWTGDQVIRLEQTADLSLRDKVAFRVGEGPPVAWRQLRLVEGKFDDPLAHGLDAAGSLSRFASIGADAGQLIFKEKWRAGENEIANSYVIVSAL